MSNFAGDVKHVLKQVANGEYVQTKRPDILRASNLPFCPLYNAFEQAGKITSKNGKSRNYDKNLAKLGLEKVKFHEGFFFAMGHSIHNLWQTTGSNVLKNGLVGDWQCNKQLSSKTTDNVTIKKMCSQTMSFCTNQEARSIVCPHGKKNCHAHLTYKELQIRYKCLGGHVDFLWRDKQNRYHVIDFKTTSMFLFEKPKLAKKLGYYPAKKYLFQAQSYCAMLENNFKIKISSYTIAYIPRESTLDKNKEIYLQTFTYRFDRKTRSKIIKHIESYNTGWLLYLKWRKNKNKYNARKLYENRPCKRAIDYVNHMQAAFFDKAGKGCEKFEEGACFNGKALKQLLKFSKGKS